MAEYTGASGHPRRPGELGELLPRGPRCS